MSEDSPIYILRKWNQQSEFKSWTRQLAFHFTLGKVMNLSLFPAKIIGQTGFFNLETATSLGEGKLWIQSTYTPFRNWSCIALCLWQREWLNLELYSQPHMTWGSETRIRVNWLGSLKRREKYNKWKGVLKNKLLKYIYICLATLMSSYRTKQICLWMTLYIYIYI